MMPLVAPDSAMSNDLHWSEAWNANRHHAMTEVFRMHAAAVQHRARMVCGAEMAADVTQEVFLRLWRNPGAFDPTKGTMHTYLMVLARGVAIDTVRSESRRRRRDALSRQRSTSGAPDDVLVLEPILRQEKATRVHEALGLLDPRQRDAITSSICAERTFCEVARLSGIPEGTVKSRVRLGLVRLRPALTDLGDGVKKKRQLMREHRCSKRVALVVMAALVGVGCGNADRSNADSFKRVDDSRLRIVTTVAPITSIVSSIVGDRAVVTGIVPEGTNSHTFEPQPSVAEKLSTANVIYLNGLDLETPTRALAVANMGEGAAIVELGALAIPEAEHIFDFSFPLEDGKPNPHLWTDPTLARRYAEIVSDDMSRRDPRNAAYYRSNYAAFSTVIDEFDAAMRTAFATVQVRKLLTYHDAYAYFARTYGWTVIGAIQISDFEDPTPAEVANLIDQVRASDVPAIFGSEVFPSPVLKQIGKEAGVRYVDELRDDDLPGRPGEPQHSWLGLMRFDFITMTEALGGDATALRNLTIRNTVPDQASYPQ